MVFAGGSGWFLACFVALYEFNGCFGAFLFALFCIFGCVLTCFGVVVRFFACFCVFCVVVFVGLFGGVCWCLRLSVR